MRKYSFLSIETDAISLKCELIKLFKEKQLLKQKCLKPNITREGMNRGSNAQTELLMNPVCSFILKGWNLTGRIIYLINPKETRACTELDRREMVPQEDRMRTFQEMEELKKLCCTEGERAKKLRRDELSIQEKESQSTVNQLTVFSERFQGVL